jgi:hypothetical protein
MSAKKQKAVEQHGFLILLCTTVGLDEMLEAYISFNVRQLKPVRPRHTTSYPNRHVEC